jgi:hypothetical protein
MLRRKRLGDLQQDVQVNPQLAVSGPDVANCLLLVQAGISSSGGDWLRAKLEPTKIDALVREFD